MATRQEPPILSVIVPVFQGERVLPEALAALTASDLPRDLWELILVDDASTDRTVEIAAAHADVIVRLPGEPRGPSYARNRGSEVARGEILVFVDADVCVHTDTLRRFAWAFAESPGVSAIFGSYDTTPRHPGFVSQYRNLLHHFFHARDRGEAETFWAGCGAIRTEAFRAAGMYDEWQFSRPQIEDIELGNRLRDLGATILLRPEIQGTHLKRWRLRDVVTSDLQDRGVPWTRLLIRRGGPGSLQSLNLHSVEKVKTALVGFLILLLVGWAVTSHPWYGVVSSALVVVMLFLNRSLYRFFLRERGLWFAVRVVPLNFLYYVLNGCSAIFGWMLHHVVGDPQPSARVQAYSEVGLELWPPVPKRQAPSTWRARRGAAGGSG